MILMKHLIYAGTYTKRKSEGIYTFNFEDGYFSGVNLFCKIGNPKYLCYYEDNLLAVYDDKDGSGTALIDKDGKIIDKVIHEDGSSCFLINKDNYVYTANYHEGTVSKIEIKDDRLHLIRKLCIKDMAGCHQIILYENKILVPCLFLDKVYIFDENLNLMNLIDLPKGSGPRHGIICDKYLYLVGELSNELFVIDLNLLKVVNSISVLDNDERHTKGTAAIRLKDNFIYVSTRFKDVISVISADGADIRLIETRNCGGVHPRDFIIIDDYLLCANMDSDNVVSFGINKNGTLTGIIDSINVPEGIALLN